MKRSFVQYLSIGLYTDPWYSESSTLPTILMVSWSGVRGQELPHLYNTLNVQHLSVQHLDVQHLVCTTTCLYNTLNVQHLNVQHLNVQHFTLTRCTPEPRVFFYCHPRNNRYPGGDNRKNTRFRGTPGSFKCCTFKCCTFKCCTFKCCTFKVLYKQGVVQTRCCTNKVLYIQGVVQMR